MPSLFSQHDSLMLHVKMFTPLSNNLSLIMIFFSFSVPRFHISQKTKKQTNKKTRNQNWENKVSQLTGRDEKQRGKKKRKKNTCSCLHSCLILNFPGGNSETACQTVFQLSFFVACSKCKIEQF